MARIGFVGLGHMGLPMALNLLKAGHEVMGYDLNASALKQWVEQGGQAAASLKDTAIGQDYMITMLQTGAQVQHVCLGEDGLYAHGQHAMHIDCSSIDVQQAKHLHEEAQRHQRLAIDAPVSGGVKGAIAGRLTFMVGGQQFAFDKAKPILEAMGKTIIHTGGKGSGQAAKICNNMILGITMIGVSEAFVLAEQLGLSPEKLAEVVHESSGQCWVMDNYPPYPGILPNAPSSHGYQPGFSAAMMLKDLLLSQQCAGATHVHTALGEHAALIYQRFVDEGHGQMDFSGIIQSIQ